MALISSVSGIRGTIGGEYKKNLTPLDIVIYTSAFASLVARANKKPRVVVGRDARVSGEMVQSMVMQTLVAMGVDVIDAGYSTTPTLEMAVRFSEADGGIMITASHNPKEWNALKLLNRNGECITEDEGVKVKKLAEEMAFQYASVDKLGHISTDDSFLQKHIQAILKYPLVNAKAIAKKNFKIVVDAINSTGALAVPQLLKSLGVSDVIVLNEEMHGRFAHNPEPLPEHLNQLSLEVTQRGAHLGIAVDPDVDRLCFVCEDGSMFGEEYTLVAVADYVLSKKKGNTVSNLSSSRALKEITEKHGCSYYASPVGEVNVVKKMKEVNAVIGGEGNGGVIVPDLHYGRDALIGIALFLSHLSAHKKGALSLRSLYPNYFISKNKIELSVGILLEDLFKKLKAKYKQYPINTEDGLRIDFNGDWVHLRASNTEPIIRIYAESDLETKAENIAQQILRDIREFSTL
ncbi:MAG: phosphoglucosamine mutase [Chitinophagaceae bacterium]|nr:phosphoglucosamine mutase [Chitinophagaceae bacterium]